LREPSTLTRIPMQCWFVVTECKFFDVLSAEVKVLTMLAMFGVTLQPRRRRSVRVWTGSSSSLWRCINWDSHGISTRQNKRMRNNQCTLYATMNMRISLMV
jgi:hypothetical protein